jgi:hypothetical protein
MEGVNNLNPSINIFKPIEKPNGHYFFGYYDICPWDKSENYLLAHRINFIDREPNPRDKVEVGFINLKNNNRIFTPIGKTSAWNFQQGARFQWFPSELNKVIYNIKKDRTFKSVIYDIKNKSSKILNYPVYSLSPKDNFALSINYSRLERLGGYGYKGIEDKFRNDPAPIEDGIFKIDLDKNEKELIISINKIAKFKNPSFNKIKFHHSLSFPTFNSKGDRFCFLHRFKLNDGGIYTRLLTANIDGSDIYLVAEGTLSYFDWFDNNHILIWGRTKSYLTKARKYKFFNLPLFKPILKILRKQVKGFVRHKIIGDQCILFKDKDCNKIKSIGVDKLDTDGHPTRFKNTPWIITDTYPNKEHYRTLILYNINKGKRIDIGNFYSLPDKKYLKNFENKKNWDLSAMRSDLHPRWNRNGDKVFFDSVHDGKKNIYIVDLNKIINL